MLGDMASLAGIVSATTRFANCRGVYAGRRATKVHVALYRCSGGRIGGRMPGRRHARILLLDHVGAKSGIPRTSPLMYVDAGAAVAIAASKAGQPHHPAWYHNLLAPPTPRSGSEGKSARCGRGSPPRPNIGTCGVNSWL